MRAVEQAGREALGEMRRLLGVIHGDPTADRARSRVRRRRWAGGQGAAGRTARHLTAEGEHRSVPPGVAVSAYRIVQEALTNVVKHAARFRVLLEANPDIEVVGEAADGAAAVEQARRLRAHVVLMDIRMPRLDGIEATRAITAALPDVRVVILTTYDLDESRTRRCAAAPAASCSRTFPPPTSPTRCASSPTVGRCWPPP